MTSALPISDVKPREGIRGATIAEVTIIATVDAPMAVFKRAEMMKGRNTPIDRESSVEERASASGRLLRIAPKEPPAPVMTRIEAEFKTPSHIQAKEFSFSETGMRVMATKIPIISAVTGSPIKDIKERKAPAPKGWDGKSATDFRAMRMIGRTIGAKLWTTPGSLPYFSISSSTVNSGLAGMSNLLATCFA